MINNLQRTRLIKAVRELKSSVGWQEIKRFILAESAADLETRDMDGLIEEVQGMLLGAVLEERKWAEEKRL